MTGPRDRRVQGERGNLERMAERRRGAGWNAARPGAGGVPWGGSGPGMAAGPDLSAPPAAAAQAGDAPPAAPSLAAGGPGNLAGGNPAGFVRTDLALEAIGTSQPMPGVQVEEERGQGYLVTRVTVTSPEAARRLGKPPGRYVTIESPGFRKRDRELQERVANVLARELAAMLPDRPDASFFVVGLGNWNATPDSLGPEVVHRLLVTRHLQEYVPEDLKGGLRSVAALAPGVLGLTGIETGDVIRGIVQQIRPDMVIAVDALAARNIERIMTTVQIADTGIHPGSGVGNHRAAVTRETLGIPVIAIGVPTVVHAHTIAYDTLDALTRSLQSQSTLFRTLGQMPEADKRRLIEEVLGPAVGDLMVTPKEIDVFVEEMATVVASGLNAALHPRIDEIDLSPVFA
ncbi:GPR endopeptidase [Thermaerobacter subterraneus]|uniref:Germination protease n=1 Tax=Thermaerobacter subterraneus DSM 13965 TaxID=867903 RepID=K6PYV3_9FIRM|nr:GPR endopeptidase [Thermaerobacter subterraneus]EKP93724.1 GPR endopeptidase [Thermaerobacter subterraneus DSM 13965]